MYKHNTDQDLLTAGLIAALGAGIVTSFAVSQGQHPLVALAITLIAGLAGAICRQLGLV